MQHIIILIGDTIGYYYITTIIERIYEPGLLHASSRARSSGGASVSDAAARRDVGVGRPGNK